MAGNPLEIYKRIAPDLLEEVKRDSDSTFADGALPKKMKLLIAMALDANHGAESGVGSLAKSALAAGATREEVMEALRVTYFIGGVGAVYTAAHGLQDVF